ncbi:MAG: hypothetical protein EPN88_11955 [Bacteroidetes bacterium]|nr:MAG: hypothetical protein EPN88_11955 [Bacteroidota bacterium]
MIKKFLSWLVFVLTCFQTVNSQTVVNQGKPIAEIFTDFHFYFNDTTKRTGFDLNRAHIGYNFLPGGNFSSTIIINVGTPEDLAVGSKPKRYAFFREASIAYTEDKLTISFGITNTRIFDFQQKFWGKRYLGPEFQALYGYGTVADLGVVIDYRISEILKVDLSVLNGEGYTNIQVDNSLKTAFGITITTPDKLAIRLYGDIMKPGNVWQSTLIAFAGFKNDLISFGAEASYKSNLDLTEGHHAWGISATGSFYLNEKSEIFGRYDYAASVHVPGEVLHWDYIKDGSYLIGGIQHTLSSNLNMALNWRGTFPYDPDKHHTDAIYLNALFSF